MRGFYKSIKYDVSDQTRLNFKYPPIVLNELNKIKRNLGEIKIQLGGTIKFVHDESDIVKDWAISLKAQHYESDETITDGEDRIKAKIENYSEMGSGWRLLQIVNFFIRIDKFNNLSRLSGRAYIETPLILKNKKCIINIKNNDDKCFLYAVAAALISNDIQINKNRPQKYIDFIESNLKFDLSKMPMKLRDIPKFERDNKLKIQVYHLVENPIIPSNKDEITKHPYINIRQKSKITEDYKIINLLLLESKNKSHYVTVTDIDRLLNNYRNKDIIRIQSKWCPNCLIGYCNNKALVKHEKLCNLRLDLSTMYTIPQNLSLRFNALYKTISPPFVVYADFESCINKDKEDLNKEIHTPLSAGMLLLGPNGFKLYYSFVGKNCIVDFLKKIDEISKLTVKPYYENNNIPMNLSHSDEVKFENAKQCYLCKKPHMEYVRDHDHFTGKFLGAACRRCNLNRKVNPIFPIVFHNLRGYDLHHIIKYGISEMKDWSASCIPQSMEKFQSLIVYIKGLSKFTIRFIDSYQFLSLSLRNLGNMMTDLPIMKSAFPNEVIKSKGILPYNLMTSVNYIESITKLPPKWEGVSEDEYNMAKSIWVKLKCKNLKEYMLYYLKVDVYLLADVFEAFRKKAMTEDELDPVNFYSVPGLSWDSALKSLDADVMLLPEVGMYDFYEYGIRGGMTFVNKHYIEANNNTSLLYIDVNNLYG